jgi:hypothetical protein
MLQEVIVYAVLAVVAGIVIYSLIKRFRVPKKSSSCDGCSGCDLMKECNSPKKTPVN